MNRNNTIRSFISLLLLCTFALSITPKKMLHTLLADHIDQQSKANTNHPTSVDIAGYHCNIDNLVAESPFNAAQPGLVVFVPAKYPEHSNGFCYSFFSLHHFYSELRGPPAIS